MSRLRLLLALLCFVSPVVADPTTSPSDAIAPLIQSLGDADPLARQRAGDELIKIGKDARPLLVKAAQSGSPQVASHASEILMKMPWWAKTDPPAIVQILKHYGAMDNEGRQSALAEIARTGGGEAALLRLVQEEPSDAVSWYGATVLRVIENSRVNQILMQMDLSDARVQVVALAARAFLPTDRAKGLELFRKTIEQDADDDGSDDAHLEFGYRVLIGEALSSGDLKQAAGLRRLRAHRAASSGDASAAVFQLIAFYADHGPTDELSDDLNECASFLGRPETMYAMGRLENTADDGSNLLKDAIGACALASSQLSIETQRIAAQRLAERSWDHEARQLLYAILALPDNQPDLSISVTQVDAHLQLSHLDEVTEDHAAVAEHLEAALRISEKPGGAVEVNLDGLKSEIAWHKLHVALEAGDKQTANKFLDQLAELPTPDSDVAIEVVRDLKAMGKADQAATYFSRAYRLQSAPLHGPLKGAEMMNNLAWLCARCGEHVDEAVPLAERALALEPENYMYLDTAAAAHFATGNPAEAARLEQRALNMRPADSFMQKQLAIFQAAAEKKH